MNVINQNDNDITLLNHSQNIFSNNRSTRQSQQNRQNFENSKLKPIIGMTEGQTNFPTAQYTFNSNYIQKQIDHYLSFNQSTAIEDKLREAKTINSSFVQDLKKDELHKSLSKSVQKIKIKSLKKLNIKNKGLIKKKKQTFSKKSLFFRQKKSVLSEHKPFQQLTNLVNIHKVELDSPINQILESINLGLLCYDIEDRNITFVNKQIKEMFNEQDNKEIFNMMNTFRNYLSQQESHLGTTNKQTSRNLDLIPNDLFTQEFKEIQSMNCFSKSQTEISLHPTKTNSLPANVQNPSQSLQQESIDELQQLNTKILGQQFNFSPISKTLEGDISQKRTIYSTQYLLKQQLNELIYTIQNKTQPENQLAGLKIKFMTSPKDIQFSKNYRQSFQSFQKIFQTQSTSSALNTQTQQKEKIIQITLTPIFQNGRAQILFIVEDVTHFNQIKVLESLNKNKSLMLSQVSHEIRNPISCVIAMLEEIQTVAKDDNQKTIFDCSQSALQSSKLLLNLLNDLLDMSQIKAGKFKLVLELFNLCDLLLETQQMMQPLAKNKQNQIVVLFDETLQGRIYNIRNDKYRIRQILINLISNSIKYTQNGHIFLILTREQQDDRYFRIAVRDEGIGIKKEFRAKLFQAFGQADDMESKAKNNPHGVGLGLMISNTIAKNLKPSNSSYGSSLYQTKNNSYMMLRSQQTPLIQQSSKTIRKDGTRDSKLMQNHGLNTTQQSNFSSDDGLMLNEELEKGSEFYFIVFNFQANETTLKQFNCDTQQSRNLSINIQIKRPSLFSNLDVSPIESPSRDSSGTSSGLIAKLNQITIRKSLDAFESEVNSSEEESQSSNGSKDQIDSPIKSDGKVLQVNDNIIISINSTLPQNNNQKRNTQAKNLYHDTQSYTQNGTEVKRLSKRQLELKQQYNQVNQQIKTKVSGPRNSLISDFQNIIQRSSFLKKQYYTFFDTEIHILIVDDDQFSALALKSKISSAFKLFNKNLALSFTTLYSGNECIQELKKRQKTYSFLFIDSQMPDLDGFETIRLVDSLELRQVCEQGNQNEDVPLFRELEIILCSGFQKEDAKLYIYRIKHYLQKPVEQQELISLIQQIFIDNYLAMPTHSIEESEIS